MCGTSGTTAAVTRVHCLCDVTCYLATDRKRLQGIFSWTDVTIVVTFNVFLEKSAGECYKLLKEGLGAYAPS